MSPREKKLVAGLVTVAALAIALPILFVPSVACACSTAATGWPASG